jgi:glucose/mannose transport system permease protein
MKPANVARLALIPTLVVCVVAYYGSIAWTVLMSFTASGMLPRYQFVGLKNYVDLFETDRWHSAFTNMFLFGGLYITCSLALGILLAIALDQVRRFQSALQTIFLYPVALSFIVTGLAWQWFLDPTRGLQHFMRSVGFESFTFEWLNDPNRAVYVVVLAGVWHAAGLTMAIIMAGLHSIDREIWNASRVDGIPKRVMYRRVILPMLTPVIVICVVLLAMDVVKSYELIVAMTDGGPGFSTDLPAKFVVDNLFARANIGLASAGATVMLVTVLAILAASWVATRNKAAS